VGKTVGRLEARLGARLFHRTTRSLTLTDEGQAFYERCLRALAEIRAGEAMLDSGRREAVGRLRVSMPVLFGRRCVAPVLLALTRRHPGLDLDLSFNDRLVDLAEEGFDLAIRNAPLGDWPGLMTRRVAGQRMAVCAAPSYLQRHGAPSRLEEIPAHAAVAYGHAGRTHPWRFPRPGAADEVIQPSGRLRLDDLDAIADAAMAGLGLAWLPCWLVRDALRDGRLIRLFADRPGPVLDCHAVWPQTPHPPLRLRLAIDALAASLPGAVEA
jgi:DNA-binding transcriptional LysR family regulator